MKNHIHDMGATGHEPMGGMEFSMEFIKLAQQLVARDWNTDVLMLGQTFLHPDEVYPVFVSNNLNNNKGTFATQREDALYYEITRNGGTNEAYVDRYYKQSNKPVDLRYYDANNRIEPIEGSRYEQLRVIEEAWFGKSKLELENELLRKELTRYSGESFEKESTKLGKGMDDNEFITLARKLVARDYNENVLMLGQTFLDWEEVYPVYISGDLQNNKGTFATPSPDNIYYEVIRNGDTNQAYVGRYLKLQNKAVDLEYWDEYGKLELSHNEQVNFHESYPKS